VEAPVKNSNAYKALMIAVAIVLLAAAAVFFMRSGKHSGQGQTDKGATTETAAAAAGARVLPTPPKSPIEPK
jgi:flagellar basal body-associated protein FliL